MARIGSDRNLMGDVHPHVPCASDVIECNFRGQHMVD